MGTKKSIKKILATIRKNEGIVIPKDEHQWWEQTTAIRRYCSICAGKVEITPKMCPMKQCCLYNFRYIQAKGFCSEFPWKGVFI